MKNIRKDIIKVQADLQRVGILFGCSSFVQPRCCFGHLLIFIFTARCNGRLLGSHRPFLTYLAIAKMDRHRSRCVLLHHASASKGLSALRSSTTLIEFRFSSLYELCFDFLFRIYIPFSFLYSRNVSLSVIGILSSAVLCNPWCNLDSLLVCSN